MATVTFIATANELSAILPTLKDLPASSPNLYIDLEGANLSRHGTISLITLYVLSTNTVYLIDVHQLGAAAFTTTAVSTSATPEPPLTLKTILESPDIPKVFFDVRNDSDALFSHFGISLQGIHDLQLMELTTTKRKSWDGRQYLTGLAMCIKHEAGLDLNERQRIDTVKNQGIKLFAPEHGGSYAVFNERPLQPIVQEYCVQDVVYMPRLWNIYQARMDAFWRVMATEGAQARVKESQGPGYQSTGEHKRYGCWPGAVAKAARQKWNRGEKRALCG
jgi:exonuclease 3'-5' domain-containing protein 1